MTEITDTTLRTVREQRIFGAFRDQNGKVVNVSGVYDVSTLRIFGRAQTETVLFKIEGTGPEQIVLWHSTGAPDAAEVVASLRRGAFYKID